MSFIYSQALVEASSQGKCLDTEQSALSSGSHTPKPCLWHDKTMEPSRLSRFGMTCKPLTESLGAELLTSLLAVFPCQDISTAGKGAGITGERSGMWKHMARIVGEVRPRFVFVENSPALVTRGLGVVLGDLAALGYDCRWTVLGAADVGAPHQRDRFWLLAHSNCLRELQPQGCQCHQWGRAGNGCKDVANTDSAQRQGNERAQRIGTKHADIGSASWWSTEPELGRVANGVAYRAHRLKAIGNGQVPLCAATAWRILGGV